MHRIRLFGIELDAVRMPDAIARIFHWLDQPGGACRFVVTPNVDHTVLVQTSAELRAAYCDAGLVLADGWPVVAASRLLRRPLPERVAGSDLAPALFKAAQKNNRPLRVFLLGAAPGVGERAAGNIQSRWPAVQVVGVYSPPLGFERNDDENRSILSRIREAAPQVLVVGLGAPKQELWVHRNRKEIAAPVALCVGATIDFLAGEKKRAPRFVRRLGLEWLHRMLSEPRRLAKRYARDAWIFPQLVWREWRST
jgi:N-acetylglucosaminyldiphosphoundecaprenol N-acetyl-beta-D-mannosaminyltransferase